MTALPDHHDRARALRFVLAVLKKDSQLIYQVSDECRSAEAVQGFVLALGDQFAMLASRRLKDPQGYLENWIALELQLAEDSGESRPSQSGGL